MFFLLSAFFLFALLAALQHSGKALGISIGCLVALALLIVFLTPVRLPEWLPIKPNQSTSTTVAGSTTTTTATGATVSTTFRGPTATGSTAGTTTTGTQP